ncbi:site-specific integrase [Bifidobacterium sp. SO4]|uniref:tyrosine-type recombinase/integrase n=1 Tax=Bifidobacterium sp. SO4 TaxID=2809030 RepID=UPI001BDC2A31|nr:site-specific integrase [Bifidobacterium sp. SO4]MBT1171358.1 site-specific integrase [Bifidobacterium sp. SO4]
MARTRMPIGTYGTIKTDEMGPGKWRARARYRFSNGDLKQVQRFGSTEAKAVANLKKALKTIDSGISSSISPNMVLSALADRFIADRRERRSEGTVQTYQVAVNAHIKPDIGKLTVREATPERLNAFLVSVAKDHGHGAAKNCRSVLSGMMTLAVRNGAINHNPVREVEAIEKPRKPGTAPIPPERLGEFLQAVENDARMQNADLVDLFKVMAGTGFRMGEVCGLTWNVINFEKNQIEICRQAKYINGKGAILQEFAKTHASMRTITAPDSVMHVLRERAQQAIRNNYDLVFPSIRGGVLDPNNAERALRERRDALGFPGISSHSLRKCVATILDGQGMTPRDIADYLGHSKPSMTLDVYMQRSRSTGKSAKKLETILSDIIH